MYKQYLHRRDDGSDKPFIAASCHAMEVGTNVLEISAQNFGRRRKIQGGQKIGTATPHPHLAHDDSSLRNQHGVQRMHVLISNRQLSYQPSGSGGKIVA